MSAISKSEIIQLSKLARLGLTDKEVSVLEVEMGEILEYAKQLEAVDTDNVEPTSQVTGLFNVYRDDLVIKSQNTRKELLRNAPNKDDEYIKVKAVL